jgi:hypothetical protein
MAILDEAAHMIQQQASNRRTVISLVYGSLTCIDAAHAVAQRAVNSQNVPSSMIMRMMHMRKLSHVPRHSPAAHLRCRR